MWTEMVAVELKKKVPLQLPGRSVKNHDKTQEVLSLGAWHLKARHKYKPESYRFRCIVRQM
jgi:hypothetical protein